MANSNIDRIIALVVDTVIETMKSQFEGKVPAATFDAARPVAVRTASSAVPFPLRLAINALPSSVVDAIIEKTEKTVGTVVAAATKKLADAGTVSATTDITGMVTEVVKTAVSSGIGVAKEFIAGKKTDSSNDSVCNEQLQK